MRRATTLTALCVLAGALVVGIAASACGGAQTGDASSAVQSSSPAADSGSPMERATAILGHKPTGLAQSIVDSGVVSVANDINYAPQSSVDEKTGDIVGFDVDVAKRMADLLGLRVKWVHPSWITIPASLQQGKFDVSIGSMTITPERQKSVDFTDPYYYTSGQLFVKKGGSQVTDVSQLDGKTVGVSAGTTYYDYLKKNAKARVKTYESELDAFPDLVNGNLDFVMTAGPTGQQAILAGMPIEFSGQPLYYEDLAFAAAKGQPDWLAMLDYTVQTMHQDGSLTAMSKNWYNGLDLTVKE